MRTSAVLALVAWTLVSPSGSGAETPATVFLEELTWTEVRDLVRSGTTTIILPTGGTEQNGPHMALGKHNVRVKALAAAIARSLGSTLVAPVLAYVPEGGLAPPTGHMRYAGTITLPERVFERVLESAARSFALHGFRDIVLIGDSGGNQAGQEAVARRLNRGWAATPTRAHAIDAYYRASTTGAARSCRVAATRIARSAATRAPLDTSLMLAVDPSVVRQERLRAAPGAGAWEGADGDPSRASAELGRLIEQTIVAQTVEAIRRSLARREARRSGRAHDPGATPAARLERRGPIPMVAGRRAARAPPRPVERRGALAASHLRASARRPAGPPPAPAPGRRRSQTVPGMPPVPDPTNLYSETAAGRLSPTVAGALPRVYVPNVKANNVTVIDSTTLTVVDTFPVGVNPSTSCRPGTSRPSG